MGKSPVGDALIALGVSAAVLIAASWFLRSLDSGATDTVGGINEVSCQIVHQVTDWTPSFPCWWLFVGVFVLIWLLVYATARRT